MRARRPRSSSTAPVKLTHAFATQLHFDHTAGYPDLVFAPSMLGRDQPLEVYGPPGIRTLTEHVLAAWNDGVQVNAHEVAPGLVYRDNRVSVIAFAGGYRLQTADRRIVIAGETSPAQVVINQCNGCDVLIREVQARDVRQLIELAVGAKPEFLILQSHRPDENELTRQIRAVYRGRFVVGHDLDVY